MNTGEKIRMARQLAALRVDVIEAVSRFRRRRLEAVQAVAKEVRTVQSRRSPEPRNTMLMRQWKRSSPPRLRLHIFLATSDLHCSEIEHDARAGARAIGSMIRYGAVCRRNRIFRGGAGRTDIDYLCQVSGRVDAGRRFNLPDTVGYAVPKSMARCSGACAIS